MAQQILKSDDMRGSASGSMVALSPCTAAHPLYTGIANIFGVSISEATMQPNPRSGLQTMWQKNVVRVGRSGSANASTIAAGVALVPDNATTRWTVQVEPGVYRERVSTAGKGPLTIAGLGIAAEVVVVFGCSSHGR